MRLDLQDPHPSPGSTAGSLGSQMDVDEESTLLQSTEGTHMSETSSSGLGDFVFNHSEQLDQQILFGDCMESLYEAGRVESGV